MFNPERVKVIVNQIRPNIGMYRVLEKWLDVLFLHLAVVKIEAQRPVTCSSC